MTADAKELTRSLQGKWFGRYGLARCPAHGDRRPSLSISNGQNGRLLLHCHTGCGFADILEALKALGLVDGGGRLPELDAAEMARREAAEKAEAQRRAIFASTLWKQSVPIHGTPAQTYLRSRGITCPLPSSLRFHPSAPHPAAGRLPAMLAMVEGAQWFALHRTYLRADGAGKADVEPAKAMLGSVRGGAVHLTGTMAIGECRERTLVVAEGIETGLSLASGLLAHPVSIWAALSTSGFMTLNLPPVPGEIIVATDGDAPGREAGNYLARRADRLGWSVSTITAPDGHDFNDVLQEGAMHDGD